MSKPLLVPTSVLTQAKIKGEKLKSENVTSLDPHKNLSIQQQTKTITVLDTLKKEITYLEQQIASNNDTEKLITLHQEKIKILEKMFEKEKGKLTSKISSITKSKKQEWEKKPIIDEIQKTIDDLKSKYDSLIAKENDMIQELEKQKKTIVLPEQPVSTIVKEIKYNNLAPQFNSPEIELFFNNDNKSRTDKDKIITNLNYYLSQINELDKIKPEIIMSLLFSIEKNLDHLVQIDNEEIITQIINTYKELEQKHKKTEKTRLEGKHNLTAKGKQEINEMSRTRNINQTIKNKINKNRTKKPKTKLQYKPLVEFRINTNLNLINESTIFILKDNNIEFTYTPNLKKIKITFKDITQTIDVVNSLPPTIQKQIQELYKNLIKLGFTYDVEQSLTFFNVFIEKINKKHGSMELPLLSLNQLQPPNGRTLMNSVWDKFTEVFNTYKLTKPDVEKLTRWFHYYLEGQMNMNTIKLYLDTITPVTTSTTVTVANSELLGEATDTNDADYGKFATQLSVLANLKLQYNSAKPTKQKTIRAQMQPIIKDIKKNAGKKLTNKVNNREKNTARSALNKLQLYNKL